jgi:apolipoprotein D and lipocalin family protein
MGNMCVPAEQPLQAVAYLDLRRYSGRWWQVALLPNSFQSTDDFNVTATYTPSDTERNVISVLNESYNNSYERTWIAGRAVIDPVAAETDTTNRPGRLIVSFKPNETQPLVWPLGAPYWVIDLGDADNYGWAVVSEPRRRFLWILSRTPQLDSTTAHDILRRLVRVHGFPAERLAHISWTQNDAPDTVAPAATPSGPSTYE